MGRATRGDAGDSLFKGVELTGAEVFWLATRALAGPDGDADALDAADAHLRQDFVDRPLLDLSALHLEGAFLREAHLESADLFQAHLEGAILSEAHLERAYLFQAHLERAILSEAHLERAYLGEAHLEEAYLFQAHLERADLSEAHLERAYLFQAHLEGAILRKARLERAILLRAHLEGADLSSAQLVGTDLSATWFDKASHLNDAILTDVSLDQASFDNTNLTVVDWSLVTILGDERTARTPIDTDGKPKKRQTRLREYTSAVRANRVLSVALQAQGLTEDVSRFAYRAQVLQRKLYRRQRKVDAYLFSLLIAALAGYGYRLGRILLAYGLSLAVFAAAYFTAGQWFGAAHLTWYQAILVSLTAIHGRVFFEQFGLNSIQSWIAAVESVVGIVIEGVFVAMLIQRFFGR